MATAAVETPNAFNPVNGVAGDVLNDEGEVSPKRSSEEADNDDDDTSSKKKRRTSAKATKSAKKGTAKKASNNKDTAVKEESIDEQETLAHPPATPTSKKAPKHVKTPESARKRATPKGETASPRGIPKSWEEAGPADRMMHRMREEGKDWNSIRKMWTDLTGEETATSSLPNRYNRMKWNMMRLAPGHDRILLEIKAQIEAGLEVSKWNQIVNGVKERTGVAYQSAFLQKNAKELEAKGGLAVLSEASEEEAANNESEENESGAGEEVKAEEGEDADAEEVAGEDAAEE